MSAVSGEKRETEWLWQRLSIAVVRGNATSVLLTSGLLACETTAGNKKYARTDKETVHKSQQEPRKGLAQPSIPPPIRAASIF